MRDRIFYALSFGFILGVLLHSFLFPNFYFVLLILLLGLTFLFCFTCLLKNTTGILIAVFVISTAFGLLRFSLFNNRIDNLPKLQTDVRSEFRGVVVDEPDLREDNQKLVVRLYSDKNSIKILLTTDYSFYYKYGDEIIFSGILENPENFTTDQGKVFDYINYLKKDDIFYISYFPEVNLISRENGFFLKRLLFSIKTGLVNNIDVSVKNPENTLLSGIILGERSSFSDELREQFIKTGTIHLVALSGYNITIVSEWFVKIFKFIPGLASIWVGVLAIILFVLMTGAPATAVRAGLMAILVLIARATGRTYDVARALTLVAVLMIFINPLILRYDVSFQLSFLATIAVIFFTPKIEKYFLWIPKRFGLRDIVAVTIAAYGFVLPYIIYVMGNLSIVAIPVNILILPFIPLTMFLGFLLSMLGLIWYGLSVPFSFLASLLLGYELKVVEVFSNLSFASYNLSNIPLWLILIVYLLFIRFLFFKNFKKFFTQF